MATCHNQLCSSVRRALAAAVHSLVNAIIFAVSKSAFQRHAPQQQLGDFGQRFDSVSALSASVSASDRQTLAAETEALLATYETLLPLAATTLSGDTHPPTPIAVSIRQLHPHIHSSLHFSLLVATAKSSSLLHHQHRFRLLP